MRISPEISAASVVLLGNFNPAIFTPAWFGWHELLPETTIEIAELKIAQPQITAFDADWVQLNVVTERFSVSTLQPPLVRLQDLVVRIFREKLPHTPLHSMGINRQIHFVVGNQDERDRIGRLLAPIDPWGNWGSSLQPNGSRGGMTSITMTEVNVEGRPTGGRRNVTVQPSTRVGEEHNGVYVEVNDHFTVEDRESKKASSEVIDLLERNFEDSIKFAEEVIDHLMSLTSV